MNSAVVAPITTTKCSASGDIWKSGDIRATMKMPAVTMVAAWIRAEIGVGPSMESGSHTCNGNLRRLAHGAEEQADADHRDDLARLAGRQVEVVPDRTRNALEDLDVVEAAHVRDDDGDRDDESRSRRCD